MQRKAIDEVEGQLRSMIAKLSGMNDFAASIKPERTITLTPAMIHKRDRIDSIVDILKSEGRPLHITMLAERLSTLTGKKVTRTEIEPGLNRHVANTKSPRVIKAAPGTFGLPEWKTNNQPALTHIAS